MSRKKQRRYKVLEPIVIETPLPARVRAIATVFQWTLWMALLGVLVAFVLVLSLQFRWHIGAAVWLRFWPASIQLMTADPNAGHITRLALWTTLQNGILYGAVGVLIGSAMAWVRSRRQPKRHA